MNFLDRWMEAVKGDEKKAQITIFDYSLAL